MIIKCNNCRTEFDKPSYLLKRGALHNFCSNNCRFEWMNGENHHRYSQVETVCSYCGEAVSIKKSQFDRAELHFCNIDCKHNYNKENGFWGAEPHNYQGEKEVKCEWCDSEFTVSAGHYNYNTKNRGGIFFCKRSCVGAYNKDNFSGENSPQYGKEGKRGEDNPSWKGGITPFIKAVRLCGNYYKWKNKCLERDEYKCQSCGDDNNLVVHHKNPLIKIVNDNNLENLAQARECSELWDINNGITLCEECHKLEHSSTRGKFI